MRVLVDAIPIRESSASIVVEHLLTGWTDLGGDDLHVALGPDLQLAVPPSVTLHRIQVATTSLASRLRAQNIALPRLCRRLGADVMLGGVPATTVAPLPCRRAVIAYDLRHELRPDQFSRAERLLRRVSYGASFRQASAIVCISDRTRLDLLRSRSWLASRVVRAAPLGADHVDRWQADARLDGPAVAFAQFGNKNADLVLGAWARLAADPSVPDLVIMGASSATRTAVEGQLRELGLEGRVAVSPWLPEEEFRNRFARAALVVFPSDFEGFGLPVAEAMRLGIPVVVSPDPALLELVGDHAAVMSGWSPEAVADAVRVALARPAEELAAAQAHVADLTWKRTAELTRDAITDGIASRR